MWGVVGFGEFGHFDVGSVGLDLGVFFEGSFGVGEEVAIHGNE